MNYINGSELANRRFIQLENGDLREVSTAHFIPAKGEIFFYLNAHGKIKNQWNNNLEETKWFLQHHPVFRTEEECEDYKKFLELLDEYSFKPNWDDAKQKKWSISYTHGDKCIAYCYAHYIQHIGSCFESEEKARAFVKAVGEQAVKRYMFDVWE